MSEIGVEKRELSHRTNPYSKRHDIKPTCEHCLVNAQIMEESILSALQKGLDSNGFMVVRKNEPGVVSGTPLGMILPLIRLLREKGFRVYSKEDLRKRK